MNHWVSKMDWKPDPIGMKCEDCGCTLQVKIQKLDKLDDDKDRVKVIAERCPKGCFFKEIKEEERNG